MTFTVRMEHYLAQWLTHALGNPVVFPARSAENALILRHIGRGETAIVAETDGEHLTSVRVVIPDSATKPSEFYHSMGRRGRRALLSAIDALFRLDLWSGCLSEIHGHRGLQAFIDTWCERKGIELDYREAVRQKFYRMRRAYREKGIILGTVYKKSLKKLP